MGNAAYSSEALSARTLEALAESTAKEHGMLAIKSDKTADNLGGFQLIDLETRQTIAGAKFELSALDVIGICH